MIVVKKTMLVEKMCRTYYHYFCKIKTATDCIAVIELENCYLYNYTDYELTSEQIQILQEMRTSLEKEVKQQTITKEAQLSALQHQINPHFLYNTMEIFSSRIELSGLYEESDAISAFCRMLRYNINTKDLMSTI